MVIGYFDVKCVAIDPTKTDTPLIVYPNAVLSFSIGL